MFELNVYFVGGISNMVFGSNKFRIRRSQSKASYLAYRRERGAPDSEGSYKRTMSPTSRLEDWSPPRDHDDTVLLRVTPHHPLHHPHHHHHPHIGEIAKSHSVDALHNRLEERTQLSADMIGKQEMGKKDPRLRTAAENNNNDNLQDRHQHLQEKRYQEKKDAEQRRERLSPQSVEVLNDRNRQLERERRKLAASCEPLPQSREKPRGMENNPATPTDDFFRERSATIELTSQNIELLNRRNEKRMNETPTILSNPLSTLCITTSSSTSTVTTITTTLTSSDGSCCSMFSRAPCSTQETPVNSVNPINSMSPMNPMNTISPVKPTVSPEKSNVPQNSPLKSQSDSNILKKPHKEASTPRRTLSSGSSSSATSSSSISSDICTSPQLLESRNSPKTFSESSGKPENNFNLDSELKIHHRKVSSPTQTDNTGSCNRSGSPGVKEPGSERTASVTKSKDPGKSMRMDSAGSKIDFGGCSSRNLEFVGDLEVGKDHGDVEDSMASPCVSPQPGIEGLTLVQRTEVVLRVNAATSDAASQTENNMEGAVDGDESVLGGAGKVEELTGCRRKLPEEIECEELSRDLASQLSPNDKLVTILVPAPEHKKPTDYVTGLFRVEATLQPRSRRRLSLEGSTTMAACVENGDDEKKHETIPSAPVTPLSSDPTSPLSSTSAYFTTSEGKARFLTRFEGLTRREDSPAVAANDNFDLRQKKEELMMRLDKKLVVLRAEQEAVREEGEVNEALGARVATLISAMARPAEASKYRLHVEEVGKITSLLLGLSGRLARAENALYGMPADHSERKILESKRDKLMDQLEEAKVLKGNIDKRSVNVSAILSKYLNEEEFTDYQHFINMKAKLIMDGREIQDKVKLGEEQLAALREAID